MYKSHYWENQFQFPLKKHKLAVICKIKFKNLIKINQKIIITTIQLLIQNNNNNALKISPKLIFSQTKI